MNCGFKLLTDLKIFVARKCRCFWWIKISSFITSRSSYVSYVLYATCSVLWCIYWTFNIKVCPANIQIINAYKDWLLIKAFATNFAFSVFRYLICWTAHNFYFATQQIFCMCFLKLPSSPFVTPRSTTSWLLSILVPFRYNDKSLFIFFSKNHKWKLSWVWL